MVIGAIALIVIGVILIFGGGRIAGEGIDTGFGLATLGLVPLAFGLFLIYESVDQRWAYHQSCQDGITQVNAATINDCDIYYDAPEPLVDE